MGTNTLLVGLPQSGFYHMQAVNDLDNAAMILLGGSLLSRTVSPEVLTGWLLE